MDTKENVARAAAVAKDHLQNEFDYIMAQLMLSKMFEKGLISLEEFNKISVRNLDIFSPELASIMA